MASAASTIYGAARAIKPTEIGDVAKQQNPDKTQVNKGCFRIRGYVQEKSVAAQCAAIVKPLAIFPEEAQQLRALIDAETEKESSAAESGTSQITERLSDLQTKLNRLSKAYIEEKIEEDSYQALTRDLLIQTCQRSHKHIGNGRKNTNGTISTGDF